MRRAVAPLVAALLVLGAAPAWASHTDLSDPNDVDGRLDLEQVQLRHEADPFVWTFRTFRGWKPREMWDRGYLLVELDTRRDDLIDYVALIRSTGRKLEGVLLRTRRDGRQVGIGDLDAWKTGPDAAAIGLPLGAVRFGQGRTSFLWSGTSLFTGRVCPGTCIDRAPDEGMVEQEIPPPPEG
ncbi:MAG TPA: hypothetical protein VFT80_16295 [Actinomycetota bacterium]|nr:hypothetical protein [Actinomycetota bacterium]